MIHFLIFSLIITLLSHPAFGRNTGNLPQLSDDNQYYEYTPHVGNIISQTKATCLFQLFGDGKGDKDGDGISDIRHESLLNLAFYFCPVLFKNSKWSPEPIKIDVVNKALKVDTWDETQDPPDLINTSNFLKESITA
jgi:hypothetical protein